MSFEKFLNLIDKSTIGSIIDKRLDIVEKTDPDRIYVENIRAFYNLPYFVAKALCETAVRQRIFRKKIGIICPNENCKSIIKTYETEEEPDETLTCTPCMLREEDKYSFSIKDLGRITFYQLQD